MNKIGQIYFLENEILRMDYPKAEFLSKLIDIDDFVENSLLMKGIISLVVQCIIIKPMKIPLYVEFILEYIPKSQSKVVLDFLFRKFRLLDSKYNYNHCNIFVFMLFKEDFFSLDDIMSYFSSDYLINWYAEYIFNLFMWFSEEVCRYSKNIYQELLHYVSNRQLILGVSQQYTHEFRKSIGFNSYPSDELLTTHVYNHWRMIFIHDDIDELREKAAMPNFCYDDLFPDDIYDPIWIVQQQTPLIHAASFFKAMKCYKFLLLSGSDIFKSDRNHNDIAFYCIASGNMEVLRFYVSHKGISRKMFKDCIFFNQKSILEWFLTETNNQLFYLNESLSHAAVYGHNELIEFLLDKGGLIETRNVLFYLFLTKFHHYLFKFIAFGCYKE